MSKDMFWKLSRNTPRMMCNVKESVKEVKCAVEGSKVIMILGEYCKTQRPYPVQRTQG